MRIPLPPVALPPETAQVALAYASGVRTPAAPRDAATVLLMRPSASGPELYFLRRHASMAFAAGMAVFPGGGVDARDSDAPVAWAGPSPAAWAESLGCTEEEARALLCAAVRETFEECGVLLAGPSPTEVVADLSGADWESDRVALESRELSLSALLERRGLVLRTDLLAPWAAWTTPLFEPRRYRTWFFVAVLPEGQVTRDVSTESASVQWLPATAAVAAAESGELALMPPTYLTALEVAGHPTPDHVLAAGRGRRLEMFTPAVEETDGGHALSLLPLHRELLSARGRL